MMTKYLLSLESANLTADNVVAIITRLMCFFSRIAVLLMVGGIVFFGLRMIMAGSSSDKFTEARESLRWALVGAIVILGVYTIIATIANAVGASVPLTPISCSAT